MNCHSSDGKPKCKDKYCDIKGGKKKDLPICIRKTKSGAPWKTKLNTELGKNYYVNEKYGLVGSKKDVKDYIKKLLEKKKEKVDKKKNKKSPKNKNEEKKEKSKKKVSTKMSIDVNLGKKKVKELEKILKKLGSSKEDIIPARKTGKVLKSDIIFKIIDIQSRKSKKTSIEIEKKTKKEKSPKKSKKEEKTKKKTIVSPPKKEKSKKKVTFAEELEEIIQSPKKKKIPEEIEIEIKSTSGKSYLKRGKYKLLYKLKSGKESKTKKSCVDKDSKSCGAASLCNILTGNCITDNLKNTREKYILSIGDKKYVGDNNSVKELQKTIGGDIKFIGTDILESSYPSKKNKINIQERISKLVSKSQEKENIAALTKKLKKLTGKKSPKKITESKSPIKKKITESKSPIKKKITAKSVSIEDPRKIMLDFEL
jgi:hypothetical protein